MRGDGGILRVRNLAQKVLWEHELSGQISDGAWENATPHDHWIPWCDAKVVVDPDNLGRDFYARRDSYGFARQDNLLYIDCIRDRMIEAVRVLTGNEAYDLKALKADLRDLQKIIKLWVVPGTPVPPQPRGRQVSMILDGYPQVVTTFNAAAQNDPKAVAELEKRELDGLKYQLKNLEKQRATKQAELDKLDAELATLKEKLGMLV